MAEKLTDDDLREIVDTEITHALGSATSKLSTERADALKYYLGEPFGNEVDGQSQVVMRSVADAVEWVLPALLKIFTSGDEVVRFEPRGPEDEAAALQQTEYVNYVWNNDNPGFMIFYTWFKDELLQKNGIIKTWWEDREEITQETYENQTLEQLGLLLQPEGQQEDEKIKVIGQEANADGTYTVKIKKTLQAGKVVIGNIPPEEFVISRDAKTIEDARLVGDRSKRSISDLIELGYDRDKLEGLGGDASDDDDSEESLVRRSVDDQQDTRTASRDISQRKVWFFQGIIRADMDGDGVSEDHFVALAGEKGKGVLLKNELWGKRRPYAGITPCPMPHRFHGRSLADQVMDIQLIESTLLRQILQSAYLSTNPMKVISTSAHVNMDDLLTPRAGGIIRAADVNGVREIATPFLGREIFPLMEFMKSVRENRTGVTSYNQGTDANSLNKTAHGISQIMSASQQRNELVARIAAETGVIDAFRNVQELVVKHQRRPRMIRLRNKWTEIDPRQWTSEMDVSINVGIGTGSRDAMLAHFNALLLAQKEIVAFQGGVQGPLVDAAKIYNVLMKLTQNMGLKNGDQFFNDPSNQQQPQQPPGPSPEEQKMMAEQQMAQQKMKADQAMAQQQMQADMASQQHKQAMEQQTQQAKMQLMQTEASAMLELEKAKASAAIELEREKAIAKFNLEREIAKMRADLERDELSAKERAGAFVPQPKAPPQPQAGA